ncbi:MAG: response regulator [Candidatus Margulisiibacteriota bacterium]
MIKDKTEDNFYDILIVDDEPFILDIFSHYLAKQGFNIQTASNSRDAYTYLESSKFDLILLDVHLKGDDFSTTLNHLKTNVFSHIPVIAVTGVPSKISDKDKKYLKAIIEKPFTPEELFEFIKQEMDWKLD